MEMTYGFKAVSFFDRKESSPVQVMLILLAIFSSFPVGKDYLAAGEVPDDTPLQIHSRCMEEIDQAA